jgi:ABC-type multidrug transport system fused ATPase/permease subunit
MSALLLKLHRLLTPPERRGAIFLLFLTLVGMALETLSTGMVIPAIGLLTQQDLAATYPALRPLLAALGEPSGVNLVLGVMLALVAVYLAKNLFLALLAWRQTRFVYGVQVELSQRLFASYLRQPYAFHLRRNSAQLVRNVTGEVNMLVQAAFAVLSIATEALVLLGISALLLAVEPLGALAAALVLGGAAWASHYGTRTRVARWGAARMEHDRQRTKHLQQGLGGAKEVKLLGREAHFLERYHAHNVRSARVAQRQAALLMFQRLWLELIAVAGLATLVIAMLAQGREVAAVLPTLGLFAAAAFRLMPSVNRIVSSAQVLRYNLPVVDSLHDELQATSCGPEAAPRPAPGRWALRSDIELAGIAFTYPGAAAAALSGLSLRIRKGESVGLIGPSGSGKSTLVDVILGLLAPDAGRVTVDGEDVQADLRAWQRQIGYVPQSIYLTDDTLRRNVAFGLPDDAIDDAAVGRAVQAAQLEEFVAALPKGLETVVGERGVRLSGGQRQRIGIARALYHDPAVLVLDEATSALDTATERGVMQAVGALRGSKTILIVAHRLSTVQQCDRLLRLEQGRVAGEETPESFRQPLTAIG